MLTPKLPSFFKISKHKAFEYKPLYYNENKEKMKERYDRIKQELNHSGDYTGYSIDQFKSKIHERWARNSYHKTSRTSNIRILVLVLVIVAILWYIFK